MGKLFNWTASVVVMWHSFFSDSPQTHLCFNVNWKWTKASQPNEPLKPSDNWISIEITLENEKNWVNIPVLFLTYYWCNFKFNRPDSTGLTCHICPPGCSLLMLALVNTFIHSVNRSCARRCDRCPGFFSFTSFVKIFCVDLHLQQMHRAQIHRYYCNKLQLQFLTRTMKVEKHLFQT